VENVNLATSISFLSFRNKQHARQITPQTFISDDITELFVNFVRSNYAIHFDKINKIDLASYYIAYNFIFLVLLPNIICITDLCCFFSYITILAYNT